MRVYKFSKSERLLRRFEFLKLSKHGKRTQNKHFIINYKYRPSNKTRLGITVSKKVGGAVTRNRLKRLVREYYRLNKCTFPDHMDINLVLKKNATHLTTGNLFLSIDNIIRKIDTQIDS